MTKRIKLFIITAVFYLLMLFLTVFSKLHYRNSLTEVTVTIPQFGYVQEDGVNTAVSLIPESMAGGDFFTIERAEVNGTLRLLAKRLADVQTGRTERGEYYLKGEGLRFDTVLVSEGAEGLYDGKEVKVRNEEDLPSWWK